MGLCGHGQRYDLPPGTPNANEQLQGQGQREGEQGEDPFGVPDTANPQAAQRFDQGSNGSGSAEAAPPPALIAIEEGAQAQGIEAEVQGAISLSSFAPKSAFNSSNQLNAPDY